MTSRVRFSHSSMTAFELVQMLNSGQLRIPAHQRDFCWNDKRQQEFIDTILQNIPTQAIILRRESRASETESLEDGRQRLTTLDRFLKDQIMTKDGRKFSQLTDDQKMDVRSYIFAVTTYHNATQEQVISIFDRYQNGIALTIGERIHSMSEISPLVVLAVKWFMNTAEPHFPRINRIFGNRIETDTRRKHLLNAVMFTGGLVFGTVAITKKWQDIQDQRLLSRPISPAEERVGFTMLNHILDIYEAVDEEHPDRSAATKNKNWNIGHITGYIIHSFHAHPDNVDQLWNDWVQFICQLREGSVDIHDTLHMDVGKARQFTPTRFKMGYLRVFDPDEAERLAGGGAAAAGGGGGEESDLDSE